MAQNIPKVTISIQGQDKPLVYRNLVLNQVVCGHHHFSFIWNVGNLIHDGGSQLNIVKNTIGATVSIQIDDNLFSGIITQITVQEETGSSQAFTIKGQSLTVFLDDAPRSASYYKKNLQKIVKSSFEGVPDNVMKTSVSPQDTEEKHYVVQYNETDFQFLQRLAIRYGEWFYYDGKQLVFGKPGDSEAVLKSGSNLTSYVIQANIKPSKVTVFGYDHHKGEAINKELTGLKSDVKNDFSSAAADKSKEIYTRADDRPMHSFLTSNKKMLDAVVELENNRVAAQLLNARGESKHSALRPGYKFVVETANGNYDYIATTVNHMSNVAGHYENSFIAVPATVKVPPYTNPQVYRDAGPQTAVVKENHDKDGGGRVKVHFPWQKSSEMTPWVRITTAHAGKDKGMHFIPEVDEEVLVDFEGGDIEKPFITGSVYHGNAKSGKGDKDNTIKMLMTKSGNAIIFNDEEGSIKILDKKGSTIYIKGDDTIEVTSKKKVTVNSKDVEVNADNNITLNAKKDIVLNAQGAIKATAMKDVKIASSTDKVAIEGMQDVSVKSTMAVKIEATTEFKAKGTVGATVEGLKLDLKGTAMASLQAALVKIN
jgi:type VI secretion system secreted protein VgrG